MNKLLLFIFYLLSFGMLISCTRSLEYQSLSPEKAILGAWIDTRDDVIFEFFKDGTVLVNNKHVGEYKFLDNSRMKVRLPGWKSLDGVSWAEFQIVKFEFSPIFKVDNIKLFNKYKFELAPKPDYEFPGYALVLSYPGKQKTYYSKFILAKKDMTP